MAGFVTRLGDGGSAGLQFTGSSIEITCRGDGGSDGINTETNIRPAFASVFSYPALTPDGGTRI